MKQYFESLGWVYSGDCGCQPPKGIYTNSQYPKWQLWITRQGDQVQFRKKYDSSMDTTKKGVSGVNNFKEGYNYWVIQNRH